MKKCVAALSVALAACGGSSNHANPCATKGATYLATYTAISGNCGQIPSTIVNVNPDGTITNANQIACASEYDQGCTHTANSCTWSSQGYNFTQTSSVTFSSDGASASGIVSLSASGAGSCAGTYNVSFVRQ